jgi:hypothetical protein
MPAPSPRRRQIVEQTIVTQCRVPIDAIPALPNFSNSSTLRVPVADAGDLGVTYHETRVVNIPIEPIPASLSIVYVPVVVPDTQSANNPQGATDSNENNYDATTATRQCDARAIGRRRDDFATANH